MEQHIPMIGFAAYSGTGKTHAMLEAARTAKQEGRDVVIGLLSCDAWPSVQAGAEGFESVRCKTVTQDGRTESEIDLDACIQRLPQLILIPCYPDIFFNIGR